MASYKKVFNGENFVSYGETETTKAEAKKRQASAQKLGYQTRVVETKSPNGKGWTVYVRK